MAEPHRHVLGEPESMPPEPVPVRAEEEGALALEAPRGGRDGGANPLRRSAGRRAFRDRRMGARRGPHLRVGGAPRRRRARAGGSPPATDGSLDDYIAVATLALALGAVWFVAVQDLRPRPAPSKRAAIPDGGSPHACSTGSP